MHKLYTRELAFLKHLFLKHLFLKHLFSYSLYFWRILYMLFFSSCLLMAVAQAMSPIKLTVVAPISARVFTEM